MSSKRYKKRYKGKELKGKNFQGENLSECEFYECDLSGTSFRECELTKATFYKCYCLEAPPEFVRANLEKSKFIGCKLNRIILTDANLAYSEIVKSNFSNSNLSGCNFDNSIIEGLDISSSLLHLASFRNVRIIDITYEPFLKIPFLRGLKFFGKRSEPMMRTIFTEGTAQCLFVSFCEREYRLDQLFNKIWNKPIYKRIPLLFIMSIFGIISDFGNSLSRWFLTCFSLITIFAFIFWLQHLKYNMIDAFYLSILCFIGSIPNDINMLTISILMARIAGYLMLSILVSLLTLKLFKG